MSQDSQKLMQSLQLREFAPTYLLDGDEPYYIDQLTKFFENEILTPGEADFNLKIYYGKEVAGKDIVLACRQFPMFAEKLVVILKDAGQMPLTELNALEEYIVKPSPSTVFVIEHRFKKIDGRTKIIKAIKSKGTHFQSDKLKDDKEVVAWIKQFGAGIKFKIEDPEAELLSTYLGNDIQKIINELEKVRINAPNDPVLSKELIQKYIGISREYNVIQFPDTFINRDYEKMYRMIAYFEANPKSAPLPLLVGMFYSQLTKLYQAHFVKNLSDKEIASAIGMPPYSVNNLLGKLKFWPLKRVEHCMLVLAKYNTKGVGIDSGTTDDVPLLKEMMAQMMFGTT